ncbi:hypothetical protein [Streptomyces spiralis]|uniref:hypothetical protein n=1 Tax=Streptomyces spiralis TaxID=66376 RepID=UPI0033DF898B
MEKPTEMSGTVRDGPARRAGAAERAGTVPPHLAAGARHRPPDLDIADRVITLRQDKLLGRLLDRR